MKKFNLTVPKPCHENWGQMTPDEKGRFCGACQKTVVDFTGMSDRELAAFFKKPVGSVCGRFQKDQLNRAITVPKKPIPWLRHFVHIAWPALILMLKSCNTKDRSTGNGSTLLTMADNSSQLKSLNNITTGFVLPSFEASGNVIPPPPIAGQVEIGTVAATVEDHYVKGEVAAVVNVEHETLMGDVLPIEPLPIDSVVVAQSVIEVDTAFVEMDTVTVVSNSIQRRKTTLHCFTSVKVCSMQTDPAEVTPGKAPGVTAYPNPIHAGHVLHLKFEDDSSAPVSIQLLTTSGQRLLHKQLGKGEQGSMVSLTLPSGLSAGIYFLQAIDATGATIQSRILVNH